jgi:glycosyltransferase involved in cell wall biosynthesis
MAAREEMQISVVVAMYNAAGTIRRTLDSVIAQTFTEFECIVVDDGSMDGSADLVPPDPRIRIVHQTHAGVSVARNRGIAEARSELIALLDADDEWDANYLAALAELASRYPEAGMLTVGFRAKGRGCVVQAPHNGLVNYFAASRRGRFIHTSSTAVRRWALEEVGMFHPALSAGEDLELWARIAARYPVAATQCVLATYHAEGSIARESRRFAELPYPPEVTTIRAMPRTAEMRRFADHQLMYWLYCHARQGVLPPATFETWSYRTEAALLRLGLPIRLLANFRRLVSPSGLLKRVSSMLCRRGTHNSQRVSSRSW